MDNRNFGEVALTCAVLSEKGYTYNEIADLACIDVDQVVWLVSAGRDGVLRGVLGACDSICAFTRFMTAGSRANKAVADSMGDGFITVQRLMQAAKLVQVRVKRQAKRSKAKPTPPTIGV